jgi:hypothetical protein
MRTYITKSLHAKCVPVLATDLLEIVHCRCNVTDGLLLNQEKLAALHKISDSYCDVTLTGTEISALYLGKILNELYILVHIQAYINMHTYRVFRAQADWTFILPRIFLRKSCATCREKCRRAAPRTEKSDKPAH